MSSPVMRCLCCLQLVTWTAYSSAKRDGTLETLLQSMQQGGSENQADTLKRPLEAIANSGNGIIGHAVADDQAPPVKKKQKSMLPNCRVM